MDVVHKSEATSEYLPRLSKASAAHFLSQQLLQSVSAVYSDSFIDDAMGTLNADMALKLGFRVGATHRVSSIFKGAKVDDVLSFVQRIFL